MNSKKLLVPFATFLMDSARVCVFHLCRVDVDFYDTMYTVFKCLRQTKKM